jgi:hypothetical protein
MLTHRWRAFDTPIDEKGDIHANDARFLANLCVCEVRLRMVSAVWRLNEGRSLVSTLSEPTGRVSLEMARGVGLPELRVVKRSRS